MDGKAVIFFIVAYLIPSAWESIAHRLLLHATTKERVRWRQWGGWASYFGWHISTITAYTTVVPIGAIA
jgi:hypothetical protein